MTDSCLFTVDRVHVQPEWTVDLEEENFRQKYPEITSKLALYDEMLISVMEKSDMSDFHRCMDRIVNRYLPKQFKEDINKICMMNMCLWAMPHNRKRDPIRFCKESCRAYRYAVLSFMPHVVDYLQNHSVILKLTVEY